MTWLALADKTERRFSACGLGVDRKAKPLHPDAEGYLLARGSLVFETRIKTDTRPQVLLEYSVGWPDQRSLTFQAIPGGGISLVQVEGEKITHAAVQHGVSARTDVLRITFAWDAPKGWGQLTVERQEQYHVTSTVLQDVRPMPLQALRAMFVRPGEGTISKDLIFAALSDSVESVGPNPTLLPETMLMTPQGYKPVCELKRGDLVVTRGGDTVPVLHSVKRTLPARGSFAPVRLRAPYFGLRDDIVVAPEQRLVIDGSEVEYLFNEEAVLVPARHLINGFAAKHEPCGPVATYAQLILPAHEAVIAAGTAVESLYIGRLRRKPAVLATTLLRDIDRNSLPEHGRAAYKELKWYDSIHLARQRAA